jgi:hypothetical protein
MRIYNLWKELVLKHEIHFSYDSVNINLSNCDNKQDVDHTVLGWWQNYFLNGIKIQQKLTDTFQTGTSF